MAKTVLKWALIIIGTITILAVAALAVPVKLWRTGEVPLPDLQYLPTARDVVKPTRVWIDTDAACGTGARRNLTIASRCKGTYHPHWVVLADEIVQALRHRGDLASLLAFYESLHALPLSVALLQFRR